MTANLRHCNAAAMPVTEVPSTPYRAWPPVLQPGEHIPSPPRIGLPPDLRDASAKWYTRIIDKSQVVVSFLICLPMGSLYRSAGWPVGNMGHMAKSACGWQTCPRECERGALTIESTPLMRGLAQPVYLIVAVNARQASAVKVSTGPLRSAVSRTCTASAEATSTHSPPLSPE